MSPILPPLPFGLTRSSPARLRLGPHLTSGCSASPFTSEVISGFAVRDLKTRLGMPVSLMDGTALVDWWRVYKLEQTIDLRVRGGQHLVKPDTLSLSPSHFSPRHKRISYSSLTRALWESSAVQRVQNSPNPVTSPMSKRSSKLGLRSDHGVVSIAVRSNEP